MNILKIARSEENWVKRVRCLKIIHLLVIFGYVQVLRVQKHSYLHIFNLFIFSRYIVQAQIFTQLTSTEKEERVSECGS